jgi:CHAD domain-containing protein
MRLALLLSALLVSGCHQASAPPADASAQNASKTSKEMSDLLRKADALSTDAAKNTPPVNPTPSVQPDHQPVTSPAAAESAVRVAPAKSKTEVMRDQAATAFGDRLATLRRTAEASRLKKDRYQQVCQTQTRPECQQLTADVSDASKTIERELGDIEDAARRAGIDQGLMRDLLAKYGF